jgi:hypothetical protein
MIPEMSSPVLFKSLASPGLAAVENVVRHEGRLLEISVENCLPVGTAVSIETDSNLLLGHVIAVELTGVSDGAAQLSCVVYLDQCLKVAHCRWPAWDPPVDAETARKLSEVLV